MTALIVAGTMALSWGPSRQAWTEHLVQEVSAKKLVLEQAKDLRELCPRYPILNETLQTKVWSEFFVAMAYFESGWKPTSRMKEFGIGIDAVTGKQIWSEGLLQLSYSDSKWHKGCHFDWKKDKALDPFSPKKTILDPKLNLSCGLHIFEKQIKNKKAIFIKTGAYWSVIKVGHKNSKIGKIKARVTSAVAECVR